MRWRAGRRTVSPTDADAEAEHGVLLRALKRMRIVELERKRAEQQRARCQTGADHLQALDGIAFGDPVDRLARAPGGAGVDEEHHFGGRRRDVEHPEVLGSAEPCKASPAGFRRAAGLLAGAYDVLLRLAGEDP